MKINKITADEAREASGTMKKHVAEALNAAYDAIRKASSAGESKVMLRSPEPFGRGAYKLDPAWEEVAELLKKDGYEVTVYYFEGQFVDIGTTIAWGIEIEQEKTDEP